MKKRLSIFEKNVLRRQGITDRNDNAFWEYSPPNSMKPILLSAFISGELMQLAVDARYLFDRHWCVVALRTENCKPYYRLMHLSGALTLIEARIAQLEAIIQEVCLRNEAPARKLMRLRADAQHKDAHHLEEMYNNKLSNLETQLKSEIMERYRTVEFLLGEKKRLLKNAFSRYDALCGRQFLRIQHYYQVSCETKRKPTFVLLQMADYEPLIDSSVLDRYQTELEQTQEHLESIAQKLLNISESKKGE